MPDDYPPLERTVSDDRLSAPLGTIIDVGVDDHGVFYLSDRQNCVVHRFEADGNERIPFGRSGQGRGEVQYPNVWAVFPNGGCVVILDFNAPPACCTADGELRGG